jgi:hypothetical protein
MPTSTAAERRTSLCAVRGALQVLHNAAGLLRRVDVDAERMLRTAEGLARSSVARLEFVHRSAATTCSAAAPAPPGRHNLNQEKKGRTNHELMVIDGSHAAGRVPAAALAPAAVAVQVSPRAPASAPRAAAVPARVLVKQSSRERSPRRGASMVPSSSSPASPSSATSLAAAASDGGFAAGQSAVLVSMDSRVLPAGINVTLHSFEAATSRWVVVLDDTGAAIFVTANDLRPAIFLPGALAASAARAPG